MDVIFNTYLDVTEYRYLLGFHSKISIISYANGYNGVCWVQSQAETSIGEVKDFPFEIGLLLLFTVLAVRSFGIALLCIYLHW